MAPDHVPATLPALLRDQSAILPDREALRHVDGRRITFAELWHSCVNFAASLSERGVRDGAMVATIVPDKVDSSVVWLGTSLANAIEVPINPQLVGDSLIHIIRDSGAKHLVTTRALLGNVTRVAALADHLDCVFVLSESGERIEEGFRIVGLSIDVDQHGDEHIEVPAIWDPACIIYTSGTTGLPKGVVVPWGQISYGLESPIFVPRDTFGPRYSYTPAFHMSGKGAVNIAIGFGDTLVVRDTFSLSQFWSDIVAHGCVYAQLFPQLMELLLRQPPGLYDESNPLEVLLCIPTTVRVEEFKRRFGVRRIASGFGMTEIGAVVTNRDVTGESWSSAGVLSSASAGFEARIVGEHDYPVVRGDVGELIVRSSQPWALNSGYLNSPVATANAWRNGWFHTGDAMREDDEGRLYFVDRLKDYIRRKGENISSFEVERYVNQHPAVAESAAIGVPAELGEQEIKIVVVARPGVAFDPADLHSDLRERMPRFMVPRFIEVVPELPKTAATDRVRKIELKSRQAGNVWDSEAAVEHKVASPGGAD